MSNLMYQKNYFRRIQQQMKLMKEMMMIKAMMTPKTRMMLTLTVRKKPLIQMKKFSLRLTRKRKKNMKKRLEFLRHTTRS